MKKLLYLLFVPLTFTACKKDSEADPDPGARVAGTYQVSYISQEVTGTPKVELSLPVVVGGQTIASGTATVTRKSENFIDGNLVVKVQGNPDQAVPLTNVEVKRNGSTYDLLLGTNKIGTADGTNLDVDISQPASGTSPAIRLTFKAKKP
ncbi:hypothetical protein GCM10023187_40650 [Nibrella viscosa]|uniref:Lipocalin-like domain-containing protein n=1 Tax=Nibrella viscosa TaxID=1084524 RepID=A0ABP8KQV0_9BACT